MLGRPRARPGVSRTLAIAAPLMLLAVAVTLPTEAFARHHHAWHVPAGATDPRKDAALIIDGETGKVLYARNAEATRHPASLTKMMTLYLLFDALRKGEVTLATPLKVSRHAAAQAPTKLYLKPGDTITVDQAIKAIVVRSANDVAVTIAEGLGGTEGQFAEMMNAKARDLGMTGTHYHNASGLPDPQQISTARDLALLARHLAYDYPQYFHYFATPSFAFHGATYETHDNLIGTYDGADGIKTGYTGASGFNLVSSVVRDRVHLIGVVMGGRTAHRRDLEMERLLDQSFTQIDRNPTLVARADIPWQHLHDGSASNPVIAGFDLPPVRREPPPGPTSVASLAPRPDDSQSFTDEDAAEDATDPGDEGSGDIGGPPDPVVNAPPAQAKAQAAQPAPRSVQTASLAPTPKPALKSAVPAEVTAPNARAWTIQIGAFANTSAARQELAAYAEKSMDVLGQAERFIVPFTGVSGETLYRARFGPFIEREAREICARLSERGQTCFAALAAR
jgi:D-alanyl-D-alanine carboxypeptidase